MTNPKPTICFRPTPVWLIFGLLVVECLLWLSERGFSKGWAVLTAVASLVVVTDASLQHLARFGQLQELILWETNVSDAGVKQLQQALPNCKVIRK